MNPIGEQCLNHQLQRVLELPHLAFEGDELLARGVNVAPSERGENLQPESSDRRRPPNRGALRFKARVFTVGRRGGLKSETLLVMALASPSRVHREAHGPRLYVTAYSGPT